MIVKKAMLTLILTHIPIRSQSHNHNHNHTLVPIRSQSSSTHTPTPIPHLTITPTRIHHLIRTMTSRQSRRGIDTVMTMKTASTIIQPRKQVKATTITVTVTTCKGSSCTLWR